MSTRKRRAADDEFDREIRAHLDLETEALIRDGMTADDARAAARRTFGNVTAVRERYYEARRMMSFDRLIRGSSRAVGAVHVRPRAGRARA